MKSSHKKLRVPHSNPETSVETHEQDEPSISERPQLNLISNPLPVAARPAAKSQLARSLTNFCDQLDASIAAILSQ